MNNPSQSRHIREKVKKTLTDRYGDPNYNNREQAHQTCLERYGVENAMHAEEIKKKLKRANQLKYGVEYTLSLPSVIAKSTQTLTIKYGGRGNASNELKNRVHQTCLERYGDEHYNNQEQVQQTCLERYGDEHYNNREQAQQTCLERYGDEHYNNQEQVQQTCLERYGSKCIFQSHEMQEVIKKTNLEKYGFEYASQSPKVQEAIKKTNLARYGVEYFSQTDVYKQKVRDRCNKKLVLQFPNLKYCYYEGEEKFYCMKCANCNKCNRQEYHIRAVDASRRKSAGLELCPIANPFNTLSNTSIERIIKQILDKHQITYIENDRTILNGKEIDIYIPEHHLAIECNGIYWHSQKFHGQNYHLDKYQLCRKKGIQLIILWEDQIKNYPLKITNLILDKLGIFQYDIDLQECSIKTIDINDCETFLNKFHLFNNVSYNASSSYQVGLFYHNELISVMSFNQIQNEWELSRYSTAFGYHCNGGVHALFKKFIQDCNPKSVTGISHNDVGEDDLYNDLEFTFVNEFIGKWYIGNNNRTNFPQYPESEYTCVYDSGCKKWIKQF